MKFSQDFKDGISERIKHRKMRVSVKIKKFFLNERISKKNQFLYLNEEKQLLKKVELSDPKIVFGKPIFDFVSELIAEETKKSKEAIQKKMNSINFALISLDLDDTSTSKKQIRLNSMKYRIAKLKDLIGHDPLKQDQVFKGTVEKICNHFSVDVNYPSCVIASYLKDNLSSSVSPKTICAAALELCQKVQGNEESLEGICEYTGCSVSSKNYWITKLTKYIMTKFDDLQ